jgi:hypothetical protein
MKLLNFISCFTFLADYWLFTILLYIAVMGIANLVAVIVPGKGKGLIANGLIVILWSFGGRISQIFSTLASLNALLLLLCFC